MPEDIIVWEMRERTTFTYWIRRKKRFPIKSSNLIVCSSTLFSFQIYFFFFNYIFLTCITICCLFDLFILFFLSFIPFLTFLHTHSVLSLFLLQSFSLLFSYFPVSIGYCMYACVLWSSPLMFRYNKHWVYYLRSIMKYAPLIGA